MNAAIQEIPVKQGIFSIVADEYHRDPCPTPALSASIAKILLTQSPLHAKMAHPRLNPHHAPPEEARFDLGSAAHTMLLEHDSSPVVFIDASDWRTKAAQEARDKARLNGQFPVLEKYRAPLTDMVEIAQEAMAGSELGTDGTPEQSIFWQEPGTWCKARVDWHSADQKILMDYKTTESAEPEAFIRQIARMGYDTQAEFYLRGWKAVTGIDATFVFMCQEITAPYAVSFVSLSNAYREIAQGRVQTAIDSWTQALKLNRWPAYSHRIAYAEPPAWMLAQFEAGIAQENWS